MTTAPGSGRERAAAGCPFPVLVAEGVTHAYGPVVALDGVALTVAPGAVVGLVGPNGSGKTTLLGAVCGLVVPQAGRLEVLGRPAGSLAARRSIALVPDDPAGLDELSVEEHVRLQRALRGGGEDMRRRAEVLLDAFGLAVHRNTPAGRLSRGLRRRAAIVAALQVGAPLTLVDEATATLDPEAIVALDEALTALTQPGRAVLLATQDLHFAYRVCDEIVLLAAGRVVAAGPPAAVASARGTAGLEEAVLEALGETDLRERVRDGLAAL